MTENLDLETIALRRKHVAAAIRTHGPEHFDMAAWFHEDEESWLEPSAAFNFDRCGTTACIGGHTALVARDKFDTQIFALHAPQFLGLSNRRLLYREEWPEWMRNRADHDVGDHTVAVEALEWLADHPQADTLPYAQPDDWPTS